MKRRLFLIYLLLTPLFYLSAQTDWQHVFQEQYTQINDAATLDGELVMVGRINRCYDESIIYFSEDGEELWSVAANTSRYGPFVSVIFDRDSNVVVAGRFRLGDDIIGEEKTVIEKYDRSGNLLYTQEILTLDQTFGQEAPLPLIQLTNGAYLVADHHKFWLLDEELAVIATVENLSNALQAEVFSDSSFVINDDGQLVVYHNTGALLGQGEDQPFADFIFKDADRLLFSSDQNIYHFSPETFTSSFVTGGLNHPVDRYYTDPAGTVLYGRLPMEQGTQASLLQNDNDMLVSLNSWQYPQRSLEIILPVVNELLLIGKDIWQSGPTPGAGRMFSSYVQRSNKTDLWLTHGQDVALVDMTFTYERLQEQPIELAENQFLFPVQVRAVAVLRNDSPDILQSAVLFSETRSSFNCAEDRTFQQIEDLGLLPQDTVHYNFQFTQHFFNTTASFPDTVSIGCFFVAAPNQRLDTDLADNSSCATLVDIREPLLELPALRVFPNPGREVMHIESPAEPMLRITLCDSQGRIVRSVATLQTHQFVLERGSLEAGLYTVQVWLKEGLVIRKVIWQ